jgi:hypothetical protein
MQFEIPDAFFQSDVIGPLVVAPASFGAIVAAIAVALWFRSRSEKVRHETMRLMIEKGLAVPPGLLATQKRTFSDLRRGTVLLAAGVGLGVALLLAGQEDVAGFALIPALVGIGYLVVSRLERKARAGDPAQG